ncbi:hypothetical protein [Bordetella petrii]|uniref:hypothetical protein n=1 Tax=Bordetella petrii TaxID=94624 RepID=UPI0012DD303E|nr:hypothetical protein [Bordetella petrii]
MDATAQEMQVRRDQLRAWISSHYSSARAFCQDNGLNESEISQLLRTKSFGPRRARKLEEQAKMPLRYLEGPALRSASGKSAAVKESHDPPWPFHHSSYDDFMSLSPHKRAELDIRVSEFIAGAIQKKRTA